MNFFKYVFERREHRIICFINLIIQSERERLLEKFFRGCKLCFHLSFFINLEVDTFRA